jgi:DNA-binding NarL/FixJ family response regulator
VGTDCGYILVVDDDAGNRDLLVALVERIHLRARAVESGEQALLAVLAEQPSLVVLDVRLPGMSGYEVCHELRDTFGDDLPILFLSGERAESFDRTAGLLLGADDYVTKPFAPDELLARVRALLRRSGNGRAETGPAPAPADDRAVSALTARELEVLTLLAHGLGQPEIAAHLVISPKTVGTHIQHVLSKLGVHSRAQAVALAHREGIVDARVPDAA